MRLSALPAAAFLVSALCTTAAAAPANIAPIPHSLRIGSAKIDYHTAFDTYAVAQPGHEPGGTITTIAYIRDGADKTRPVIFAFNGGPGGSSIFLNLGLLGPQRIDLPVDTKVKLQANYPLAANGDSVLDVADVVLIDPVGTGFSRLIDDATRAYFYSVTGDAESVANAIQAWSRAHGRLGSPKYILGESYGAVRAVEAAGDLVQQADEGATLKGVIVLSQSLPIIDTVQRRSNIVGQVVGLPTLAATAWFHKLAGQGETLTAFVRRAQAFGMEQWLPALFAGTTLNRARRHDVAGGLSEFTGLPASYFLEHDLYLSKEDYRRLALGDKGLILGLYDTRYTGPLGDGRGDPSNAAEEAFIGAGPALLRDQFNLQDSGDYRFQARLGDWIYVGQPFTLTNASTYRQVDYVAHLSKLMTDRPNLKLFVAGGWFDTAASAGADEYLMSRFGLDHARITSRHYIGGHMFYTDPQSRALFAKDLRDFLAAVH